jgi:hypothetical protein
MVQNFNTKKLQLILYLVIGIVLVFYQYNRIFFQRAVFQVHISVTERSRLQVFWTGKNQPFSEKRSAFVKTHPNKNEYTFRIGNLSKIDKIRIDPSRIPGVVEIKRFSIEQDCYQPLILEPPDDFANLVPGNHIGEFGIAGDYLSVSSTGNDPQFYWNIFPEKTKNIDYLIYILTIGGMLAVYLVAIYLLGKLPGFTWIAPLLWVALCLIAAMAYLSPYNKHPDEFAHAAAAKYYERNWLPPEICQEGTEHTYSIYGSSRLNSKEVVYFLAGKFSAIIQLFVKKPYVRYRLFNVFLFLVIIILFHKQKDTRYLIVPFVISPQIWYVFSYFNSDAFSLFMALAVVFQLVYEK